MSHDHAHHHHDEHGGASGFGGAFWLNLVFTLIEVVGGVLTNSVAILSDAVHDLGDSIALAFSWAMERMSRRERTKKHTFGFKRYSVLGAVVSAVVLLVGSVFILSEAVPRLWNPEAVKAGGMLPMAVAGITFNGLAALRLRGGTGMNRRVVLLHLLEDILGWIGVLVVSIVLLFADLPILDPILSIVITVFVLSRIVPRLRQAAGVFLQSAPENVDIGTIERRLEAFPHVLELHDVHAWTLDGNYNLFSSHVVVDEDVNLGALDELKTRMKRELERFGVHHATLEFETAAAGCADCDL